MRVRCPHCENSIDLIPDTTLDDIACPSCGSHFSLLDLTEETETVLPQIAALRNFELLERVGIGHFGTVWKARDATLERFVAIKMPHRQTITVREAALFFHEAQSAASLQHPNIVAIHEVGRDDNLVYIVSQFIDGLALNDWLKINQPDFRRVAELCCEIGSALHHAHEQGIVHRDLKPQNVLIDRQGKPYITDFGLAKRDNITYTIAVTGQPLGTPAYMPPEQARGEGNLADRRSDTYSLGVMLYEMLTGARPFSGGKQLVLHQILHHDPRPPRSINKRIPRDLETICLKALSKDPKRRYQTAQAMVTDLQHFLRGEPIEARPVSLLERGYRWARRRPAVATSILLSLVVVGLLLFVALRGEPGPLRRVLLNTSPPGANVLFIPLDGQTGIPLVSKKRTAGRSPVDVKLPPNDYLVVAYVDDGTFNEVYRHVPGEDEKSSQRFAHTSWSIKEGSVVLPDIRLFKNADVVGSMVIVKGGTTTDPNSSSRARVPDFYVEATEMTIAQLQEHQLPLPLQLPNDHSADAPQAVTYLTHDEAVEYAELTGTRLLEYSEYYYLASLADQPAIFEGLQQVGDKALQPGPPGDIAGDEIAVQDGTVSIRGIFSNVDEWTNTWFLNQGNGRDFRVHWSGFGRPLPAQRPDVARLPTTFTVRYSYPSEVGMRRARSPRPRLEASQFVEAR